MRANEFITESKKQRLDPKCWKGKHKEGTKIKGGVRVNNCVPNESVEEAADSKFVGFMNKAMGDRQDKAPAKYDPATTMSMSNMPGYKYAFKFGMDIIKKMDPDTKQHFAEENDDALFSYILDIGRKKKLVPSKFVEEDLDEVTGEFEEIFHDPEMEGWSWADLLRDMIGAPVQAHRKANVQAHKAQMAKAQAKMNAPIDPKNLQVVDRTDTGESEIWYPQPGPWGDSWIVVSNNFNNKQQAEEKLQQLQRDPNVNKIIQAAINKEQGVAEGLDELSRILDLSGLMLTADEQFDIIESMVESWAEHHGVDTEQIWEDFESVDDFELLDESAAWHRKEGKSKSGGLNDKGIASYRRENPGSKLQKAVTTKPSKLKKGSKAAKRRKSFCARMSGVKGPMKKPNGKPTRKALALRKWNC